MASKSAKKIGDLPVTMKAAAIDRFGGPEVITIHTLPVPEDGPKPIWRRVGDPGIYQRPMDYGSARAHSLSLLNVRMRWKPSAGI
jgi:hypothetical protein